MAENGEKRPGVMLYFDLRPCLKRLSNDEKGRLLEAILAYGEEGILPEVEGMLGVAWDFIRPGIDRDAERYRQVKETRRCASRRRWDKETQDANG